LLPVHDVRGVAALSLDPLTQLAFLFEAPFVDDLEAWWTQQDQKIESREQHLNNSAASAAFAYRRHTHPRHALAPDRSLV